MDEEEAESTSHNLLSNLIETVFIPRLLLIVRDSFDPFNEEMNIRLAEMVEEVGLYVERSSARFQVSLLSYSLLSLVLISWLEFNPPNLTLHSCKHSANSNPSLLSKFNFV